MSKFENDLSKGSVPKQLIKFAMPVIISNLIQSLYSIVDMIVVGQFAGALSMSGVNIGGQVTMLVTNMVFGFAAGGTVLIAQYLGAKDRKSLQETISSLFSLLGILAAVLTVLMLIFKDPILVLIKTPKPSFDEASNYLLITALGTVFIFGYNALSAIMRGMGDSKRPLIFISIACGTNIVLDILMVAVFKMGAMGAGLATIVSQALSMILCIRYMRKNNFVFDFGIKSFKLHKEKLSLLLKIGIPMSVQNVCTSISFLFLTAMVNVLDPTAIASAAVGAVGKFNSFGILPAFAISNAVSAMSAQNLGANEEQRAIKTMKTGIVMGVSITFVVFLIAQIFPRQIIMVFADDEALIAAGAQYLKSFSWDYIILPFVAVLNALYIGAGHTTFSFINGIISALLVRIPVCYIFGISLELGLFGVGLGAPCASAISLIICIYYYFSGKWKVKKIIHKSVT